MELLRGTQFENDVQLMYLFLKGLEADIQAKVMAQRPETLEEAIRKAWEYFREPRPPAQIIMAVPEIGRAHV